MFRCIPQKKCIVLLLGVIGLLLPITACSTKPDPRFQPSALQTTRTVSSATLTPEPPVLIETDDRQIIRFTPTASPTPVRPTPATTEAAQTSVIPPGALLLTTNVGHEIMLIDVSTGAIKNLFPDQTFARFVEWRDNGCQLVVRSGYGDYKLVSLQGEWIETLFSYSELEELGLEPYGYRVSFSPDERWLWYWQVSGRPYNEMGPESLYEIQNIYTISRDFTEGPFRLTENGGGWFGSWAPNGQRIAFSDYDKNGIMQVFISNVKGEEKIQITEFHQPSSFDTPVTGVDRIEWSPDGNKLAVTYTVIEGQNQRWATIIVDSQKVETVFEEHNARFLWWVDDSTILLQFEAQPGEATIRVRDLRSNDHSYSIQELDYPHFRQINPFIDKRLVGFIAFIGEWQFFVFDSISGSIISFSDISLPIDIIEWVATPAEFPGINFCAE